MGGIREVSWEVHLSPALRDEKTLHVEGTASAHSGAAWSPATA